MFTKAHSIARTAPSGILLPMVAVALLICAGCAAPSVSAPPTVSDAARNDRPSPPNSGRRPTTPAGAPRFTPPPAAGDDAPIAFAAGRPIPRGRVLDLLLRGHGPEILEQLIVLEGAEAMAAEKGLSVTQGDLDAEHDRALRRLTDPLADAEHADGPFDHAAAERVLDALLLERGLPREEFRLGIERNAILRKIAEAQIDITDEQLRAEFDRVAGERVEIRHIQTPSLREAAAVQERLSAGEDFAELARRHSANLITAGAGGLLAPFSAGQEEVPKLIREAAFRLKEGEVSEALKVGTWYHLLRLQRRLPAGSLTFDASRDRLRQSLRDRLAEKRMQELYAEIFRKTEVRINDQVLKEAFEKRYPQRGR